MHCTEPVILERQMNSFGKNSFINKDFHSCLLWNFKYEVEYMAWHSQ